MKARLGWKAPPLGKNFVLQALGEGALTIRRIQKAFALLRDGTSWRQFSVVSPTGAQVPLLVGRDKSRKQIALERAGRALHEAFRAQIPEHLSLVRKDGMVTYKWAPLARALPAPDRNVRIEYNHAVANIVSFDRLSVAERVVASLGAPSAESVAWSS